MKQTKRLLALLLTLALALTLALPAFAETDPPEEPNPAMPVITVQPEGPTDRLRASYEGFMLRVEATIPNGDPISYRWYQNGVDVTNDDVPFCVSQESEPGDYYYYVEVYNRANPAFSVTSETIHVEFYISPVDWLRGIFENIAEIVLFPVRWLFTRIFQLSMLPTAIAGGLLALGGPIGLLILLPFSPILLPLIIVTLPIALIGIFFMQLF
ncbi:MAG: hypothetical protein FWE98_02235 [Oscillospiraceae bacterium]|nr:hypothetical protein [Oscillospiraceae bacterium]